jgi:hypothetical protein
LVAAGEQTYGFLKAGPPAGSAKLGTHCAHCSRSRSGGTGPSCSTSIQDSTSPGTPVSRIPAAALSPLVRWSMGSCRFLPPGETLTLGWVAYRTPTE